MLRYWELMRLISVLVLSIALIFVQVSAASTSGVGLSYVTSISDGKTSSHLEVVSPINEVDSLPSRRRRRCKAEEYWDKRDRLCKNCTVCYPGTEHKSQKQCGYGFGVRTSCRTCRHGYYQEEEGYSRLRCRPCVTCNERVKTLFYCTVTNNTQCGPCPPGWYYAFANQCLDCLPNDDIEECRSGRPTLTPSPLTSSSTSSTETTSNQTSVDSHLPSVTTSSRAATTTTISTTTTKPVMVTTWPTSTVGAVLGTQAHDVIETTTTRAKGAQTLRVDLFTFAMCTIVFVIVGSVLALIYWRYRPRHAAFENSGPVKYSTVSTRPSAPPVNLPLNAGENTGNRPLPSVAPSSVTREEEESLPAATPQAGMSGTGSNAEESTLKGDESRLFLLPLPPGTSSSAAGNGSLPHDDPPSPPTADSQDPLSGDSAQGASIMSSACMLRSDEYGGDISQRDELPEYSSYVPPDCDMIDFMGMGAGSCNSEKLSMHKSLKSEEPKPEDR